MSRRALLVAVPLAAVAAWLLAGRLLGSPGPSDEEQIRALFAAAAQAVGEKRVSDAVAGLSERFRGAGGWTRREVQQVIAGQVLRGEWLAVTIAGDSVEVEGDRARAALHLVVARSGKGASLAGLLPQDGAGLAVEAELEREAGAWRVVSAAHRTIPIAEALQTAPELPPRPGSPPPVR